jgi:hypothetical protein
MSIVLRYTCMRALLLFLQTLANGNLQVAPACNTCKIRVAISIQHNFELNNVDHSIFYMHFANIPY